MARATAARELKAAKRYKPAASLIYFEEAAGVQPCRYQDYGRREWAGLHPIHRVDLVDRPRGERWLEYDPHSGFFNEAKRSNSRIRVFGGGSPVNRAAIPAGEDLMQSAALGWPRYSAR